MKKALKWLVIMMAICLIFIFNTQIRFKIKEVRTERYMSKYRETIRQVCEKFSLSPSAYASVVFAERLHNVNHLDKADFSRARLGFDASVGFAQMKISTCEWIELHHSERLPFSPSKDRAHLIHRLSFPDTNMVYSVVYCRIIQDHFMKRFGYLPDVAALGSYYGRGIDYGKTMDQEFYLNELGLTAHDYYTRHF
jgi:hypothetical protein